MRAFLICCCPLVSVDAQTRPVVLISEVNSTRAIAFDSVTLKKEPFSLASPFAADGRTRVMLFALNLPLSPGDDLSVLTAKAEDGAHRIHILKVEYVAPVAQLNWLSAVVLRLSDSLVDPGDLLIQLHLHGNPSNRVRLGFRTVGGGPPNDIGAGPTPAPPYVLSGRVTDANGTGMAGVNVGLSGDQVEGLITGADGNFSFLVNAFGSYSLGATREFFNLSPAVRTFNNLSNSQANLIFNAVRRTHKITGRVLDDNNVVLSGINVSILDQDNNQTSTTTAPDGTFSFAGLGEGFQYQVAAATTPLFAFAGKNVDLLLTDTNLEFKATRRSYQITGKVQGATNNFQPGLPVTLTGLQSVEAITDATGRFVFTNVPAGFNYSVKPQSNVFYEFTPQAFNNLTSNADTTFTGTLRKYELSGTVTLEGAPAGNHVVQLTATINATTTTNSAGQYLFQQVLATGNYQVEPAPTALRSFSPQFIAELPGNRTLNFSDVARRYNLIGTITDAANRPLPGISLNLSGDETGTTKSRLDGKFSLPATVLGSYEVTPSIEQDYYEYSPPSQSVTNLFGDRELNYTAVLKPIPNPQHVLEFDGAPKTVDYGDFFPECVELGSFFWEFWAMPGPNAASTYMLSDGYGGLHALLFGFANFSTVDGRYELSGNINDGVTTDISHLVSFGGDSGPAVNEWGHLAVGWDGQSIVTYFNGVPVGKIPYAKPRKSTGPGMGAGRLLIGGSDHNNFRGRIAQVRGFEGTNPRTSVEAAFAPESVFGVGGNLLSYYFTPSTKVADLSFGYRTGVHVGTVRGTAAGVIPDCGDCPAPQYVLDPTAPNFALNTPGQQVGGPAPAPVPFSALVFDSFSRANSTYVFGGKGGLGSTEGGLRGPQVWQMPEEFKPFGILGGRGVVLANNAALAWVDAGGANLDIRVIRRVGRWGSGTNTGLSFRVVDPSNYFFAYTADSIASPGRQFLIVGSVTNGVRTTFATGALLPFNWTTLRVVTKANGALSVFADVTQIFTTETLAFASATKAGLFNSGPGMSLVNRWDNFSVFASP